jgi:cytochrome c-type biogenesis protein CcmH
MVVIALAAIIVVVTFDTFSSHRNLLPVTGNAVPLRRRLAFVAVGAAAVAAASLYALVGRRDQPAPLVWLTPVPAEDSKPPSVGPVPTMIGQLEARMRDTPNDAEGWRMLGWSYFETARFAQSAQAYKRAFELAPDGPGYASAYGEALVEAEGGSVSETARRAFEAARVHDPNDARARYFLGVSSQQHGDTRAALDAWLAILAKAPADAPWTPRLRQIIVDTAQAAGLDVSARLAAIKPPPLAAPVSPALSPPPPTPSAAEVAAAARMSDDDRQAMIRAMVDQLAARLKAQPADADGWIRLMRARMVLGDTAAATAARREALAAFPADHATRERLSVAAAELRIPPG